MGSKLPYRRAAALLSDLLPVATNAACHSTVRRHTLRVGTRLDERISEPEEYDCHRQLKNGSSAHLVKVMQAFVVGVIGAGFMPR